MAALCVHVGVRVCSGPMPTRVLIWAAALAVAAYAVWINNLTLAAVAVGLGVVVHLLHAIEFKLNKLLDHFSIFVNDRDISKD